MERKFDDTRWSSYVSIYIVEQNFMQQSLVSSKELQACERHAMNFTLKLKRQ